MDQPISKDEFLAVMLAPARSNRERSRALPAEAYRDPANNVQLAGDAASPKKSKKQAGKVNKKWR